jgi:hypothetical protein
MIARKYPYAIPSPGRSTVQNKTNVEPKRKAEPKRNGRIGSDLFMG